MAEECVFFAKGACRWGERCAYRHTPREAMPQPAQQQPYAYMGHMGGPGYMSHMSQGSVGHMQQASSAARVPSATPKKCRFYASGNCRFGTSCRFVHEGTTVDVAEPSSPPPTSSTPPSSLRTPEKKSLLTKMIQTTPAVAPKEDAVDVVYRSTQAPAGNIGFQDFDVKCQIGSGLVGEVYLVRLKQTGTIFAMKVIPKELVLAQNMVAYIREERSIMGKIDHPFIAKLHYAFQTGTQLVLILEYMCGGDLGFHVRRTCQLDEESARFYGAQIFLAVRHLHQHSIIHRDLKLSNVLLDEGGFVRVTDFGFAKQVEPEQMENPRGLHTYCGTVSYMAPEIVTQVGHGKAADWWSFGIIIFEMLLGTRPFDVASEEETLHHITNSKIDFPKTLSSEAISLMRGLLDRDPEKRLQAEEIEQHPFFASIDWVAMEDRKVDPPHRPYMDSDDGDEYVGNFPSSVTNLTPPEVLLRGTPAGAIFTFEQFTYEDPGTEAKRLSARKAAAMNRSRTKSVELSLDFGEDDTCFEMDL